MFVLLLNAFVSIALFYLSLFNITPKTNLAIFILAFGVLDYIWRRIFNLSLRSRSPIYILIIGSNQTIDETASYVAHNPHLGYRIERWTPENDMTRSFESLAQFIAQQSIDIVIVPNYIKRNAATAKIIYKLFSLGIEILDFSSFYEVIFGKIPLNEVEETWLLENIARKRPFYRFVKRCIDIILAAILFILTLPLIIIIALAISLTSRGPIIYAHTRIGENGRPFTLYKFRSMIEDATHRWPRENDRRITRVGRIIRRTHLDELPQLVNIIRGEVSFVGPRPDFTEFFKTISQKIPYYTIRTLVRPGVSGWAQINYPITASLEETRERLAYDLYYLKHCSFILDIRIMLKTAKVMLIGAGR